MQGSTHIAIGFMTGAAVALVFHVPLYLETGAVITVAAVASLLPDIDHPNSRITHSVRLLGVPFRWLSHRGLTHSLLALIILTIVLVFLKVSLVDAVAFIAGYMSHLLADALTPSGIRLLYPSRRRFRLLPKRLSIQTGGFIDTLFAFLSLLAALVLLIQMH